jgi:hypothetical protein
VLVAIVVVDLRGELLLVQAAIATLDEMRGALSPGDVISVVQKTGASVTSTMPSKRSRFAPIRVRIFHIMEEPKVSWVAVCGH